MRTNINGNLLLDGKILKLNKRILYNKSIFSFFKFQIAEKFAQKEQHYFPFLKEYSPFKVP